MAADFHSVTVAGIVQETADARSFVLGVPDALREKFVYRAGQFLTFEIPWNGITIHRSYSLASAPEMDAWPKVTVKRVDGGRASNWFNSALKVGDQLRVRPPEGRFLIKPGTDTPITLFAGGSGITPVLSILKSALVTTKREVLLVYANRDARSIIFRDDLELLSRMSNGRVRVHHHLDTERGFLDVARATALLADRTRSDVYICGPGPFMDTVEAATIAPGVSIGDRFIERYASPIDADRRAPEVEEASSGDVPSSITITLDKKTTQVPYSAGLTLLKAAVQSGVDAPSSCEDGYCGCCMSMLRSGKVHMATHEALTDADIKKGWVLACQSKAVGPEPIVLDFDAKY